MRHFIPSATLAVFCMSLGGVATAQTAPAQPQSATQAKTPAPVVGADCKLTGADGNPIGGIIVKGGKCMAVVKPTGPTRSINEKGIK